MNWRAHFTACSALRLAGTWAFFAVRATPVNLHIQARGPTIDIPDPMPPGKWHVFLTGAQGTILSSECGGGLVGAVFGRHAYRPAPNAAMREAA